MRFSDVDNDRYIGSRSNGLDMFQSFMPPFGGGEDVVLVGRSVDEHTVFNPPQHGEYLVLFRRVLEAKRLRPLDHVVGNCTAPEGTLRC